jgi:hypothetical protein
MAFRAMFGVYVWRRYLCPLTGRSSLGQNRARNDFLQFVYIDDIACLQPHAKVNDGVSRRHLRWHTGPGRNVAKGGDKR